MTKSVNWAKLFKVNHIEYKDTVNRGWINICCPFCNNPKDTHFNGGFSINSPRYSCWRCGNHHYYDVVMKLFNLSFDGAKNLISSYQFYSKDDTSKKIASGHNLELPGYATLNEREISYLKNRGFDVSYLKSKFKIRGGDICGDWAYRILIPIYYNHVLVSWTGRSILDRKQIDELKIPRYKNLSIKQSVINPKEIFFNLDNSNNDKVILVEGPFDVLKMGDDCICSLGTSVTHEQQLFLQKRYKKIFVAFDNEAFAQIKAMKLGEQLYSVGLDVEVVNICEDFYKIENDKRVQKNDPGELTYTEVDKIKKELGL